MKLNSVSAICISIMLLLSSLMFVTGAGSAYAQATGPAKYFAIYYTITSSQATKVYTDDQIIHISEDYGLTLCYIPALNITTCVGDSEYQSPDWSPYTIKHYTVDDRLFLIYQESPIPPIGPDASPQQSTRVKELNPANCTSQTPTLGLRDLFGNSFSMYEPTSFAVVNNNLYFSPNGFDSGVPGSGIIGGGELYVVDLASGSEKQLLTANDPDNWGTLISAGGNLYRYDFSNGVLTIDQIDLGTGKSTYGVNLSMPPSPQLSTNAIYSDWSFSADKNTFYIAAAYSPGPDTNNSQIRLWTIPLTEFQNNNIPNGPDSATGPDYWFNVNAVAFPLNETGVRLMGIDACEGHVLLNIGLFKTEPGTPLNPGSLINLGGLAILQDFNSGTYITIPGEMDNAYILYGATNPQTIISPSPPIPEMPPLFAAAALIVATCAITIFIKKKKQSRLTHTLTHNKGTGRAETKAKSKQQYTIKYSFRG